MASILTIANDVADDLALVRVTTLFDVTDEGDQTSRQLLRSLTRVCRHLISYWNWPAVTAEHTFTSGTSGAAQSSAIPSTLLRVLPMTMYDRTNDVRVEGPLTPSEWQERQALTVNIRPAFMTRGRTLYLSSPHATGATIAYEYVVNSIGTASDGSTRRAERFTTDTDLTYWSDELIHLGMVWAMKHRDGLTNNADFEAFQLRANDEITREAIGDVINMSPRPISDDVYVPEGTWDIT
jgi:hypothetical protein